MLNFNNTKSVNKRRVTVSPSSRFCCSQRKKNAFIMIILPPLHHPPLLPSFTFTMYCVLPGQVGEDKKSNQLVSGFYWCGMGKRDQNDGKPVYRPMIFRVVFSFPFFIGFAMICKGYRVNKKDKG